MDSKCVNREIRRKIRPLLKEAGFTRFTARSAWRYADSRAELFNFQSFNANLADSIGCTTFSFSVNLGSYLFEIPAAFGSPGMRYDDGKPVPQDVDCHFRGSLTRSFRQLELARRDIWYIDAGGDYLERAMDDVRRKIVREALPWFNELRKPDRVLEILLHDPEDMTRLWGFGRNPSPLRSLLTGYASLAMGRQAIARGKLREALESGCFELLSDRLATDIASCGP